MISKYKELSMTDFYKQHDKSYIVEHSTRNIFARKPTWFETVSRYMRINVSNDYETTATITIVKKFHSTYHVQYTK